MTAARAERTLRTLRRVLYVAWLPLAIPSLAEAANIRGRIDGFRNLLNPVWADARDPKNHGYSFREPVPTVKAEFRRLFPHIPKEICVAALAATPQKPGGAVELRVGGGREWTVPEPGVYEIRDELSPSLRTWIVAEPNVAAIGYPSLKGDFSLSVAEPGDYTVQAYFAGKKVGPALPVTVAAADIDISRSPLKVGDAKEAAAADKAEAERDAAQKAEETGGDKAGGAKK